MLFLMLLIPLAILCSILAWLSWRARHRKVALVMVGISLFSTSICVVTIISSIYFYQALEKSLG
ncbi:MAG: hypothetical protein SCI25_15225 [Desulfuromonadales bacterium]|nr:hypothetical protein [Desulfuromonadales bacterium]MDW7758813.1 hypothetical protein [Desulfuromonadales bacterium]